jgi:hypothetical protein
MATESDFARDRIVASDLARERIAANPYSPLISAHSDQRKQHSLDYIAFCLGEIEKHLSKIADALGEGTANSNEIRASLKGIQTILPGLLQKKD